ncbi:cardiolipin synthase [Roseospirillum parvum]|uniref:CDP-diacylglycerol--glycerol-3-phosphate 3-phosphatidyltransferase n=2 Tax=Roseospirillum parvum TaxID=83401 RepID=A0A1G7V873_9PROT|nr:cardiolipin synthase [Roseospirillum parvum]
MYSLPNLLTLSRIAVIPLVIATFYVSGPEARWVCLTLFVAAAITDFFDGWLARRSNQVSAFGRFLDPIADKLLVAAVLLLLPAFGMLSPYSFIPAIIILCREILVSGLREFLAEVRVGMPVTRLAKWKTTAQMTALGVLIVGDHAGLGWLPVQALGEVLLWAAAGLTVVTGHDYLKAGLSHMRAQDMKQDGGEAGESAA